MVPRQTSLFSALMALWLSGSPALADEELRFPEDRQVCSPNGVYCAEMNVRADLTTVTKDGRVLWSTPGWFRDAYLADDGEHLVVGYWGQELLPARYSPDATMITFQRRAKILRQVPLSDIIVDRSNLIYTAPHYYWGYTRGFDAEGRFLVQTVEDRMLAFDVKTGDLIEVLPSPYRIR